MQPEQDPDDPLLTRSDKLVAEMRRRYLPPGQFRLSTMLVAIVVAAAVFAFPKLQGWTYEWYFGFLWIVAFALAPMITLIVVACLPGVQGRGRMLLVAICLAVMILPVLGYIGWTGEALDVALGLLGALVWFWLPQVACIGAVWYFVFRQPK